MGLAVLLLFALPVGLSVTGCHHAAAIAYCNAGDSGPQLGQVATITLAQNLATTGESLNYGQIGTSLSATAQDCKGNAVSVRSFIFGTSDMNLADVNPSTGQVCGGTWNRNTGGGIADYTVCTPPATTPSTYVAYITATADGKGSNAIPVYIHPVVTGIVLGGATPAGSCPTTANPLGNDPGTDCCPNSTTGAPITAPIYSGNSCISQGTSGQLVARIYANGGVGAANNITCKVGHISFAPQTASNIVSIDQNGLATANQPGSTVISTTVSNSSSGISSGFFSTCPPASITLSVPGQSSTTVAVSLNHPQPVTAVVKDTKGVTLTGVTLEYNSTTPQTITAASGVVTPSYPGTATITAVCNPGSCNPAPFSQIGYLGNGKPITSNGITVNTTGSSGTVLYMASTASQYVQPMDFTTGQAGSLIKLPYVPNSMVISQDGSQIYFGSSQALMTLTTFTNTQGAANTSVTGKVLSISPDGTTLVVTDPVRQTISLYSTGSSSVTTAYGGVATAAAWSPDSATVYITTTANNLLTHNAFTNWQSTPTSEAYSSVAVTVPAVGAYFGGPSFTDGRSYCSSSTISTGTPPTVTNVFAPLADENAAIDDVVSASTDGLHILGATASTNPAVFNDLSVSLPVTSSNSAACPTAVNPGYFTSTDSKFNLTGITATAITGVAIDTNSQLAVLTYAGSGGKLPLYALTPTGAGTLSYVTLGNGATTASAPVSGVFSTDNLSFYAGTSGDNQVHIFSINGTNATETGVLTPNLPSASGTGTAPINLLVQHVKKLTS